MMTHHFYIHIPFCKQKCPYCKFALTPVFDEFKKKRYIEYLKKEITTYFKGGQRMNSEGLGRETVGVGGKKELGGAKRTYPKGISNATESQRGSFSLPNAFDTFGTKSMENSVGDIYEDSETSSGGQKTIYFGGGTPSILTPIEIKEILECFPFYGKIETEITLESNPEDITEEYILSILELGINRISVGIQTLNEKSLTEIHRSNPESIFAALNQIGASLNKALNDEHTVNSMGFGGRNCLSQMKTEKKGAERTSFPDPNSFGTFSTKSTKIGIEKNKNCSLNIDFILGLPYTKSGEILQGIQELHKSFPNITHTSVYILENELYPKNWKDNSISENELKSEFLEIIEYFESIGWNHYEFSNWAKPGYESIHNRAYWNHSNSRGFGLSGASYEDRKRWNNSSSFTGYYREIIENEENLTNEQIEIENMMFGLRTDGWNIGTQTITSTQKIQKLIDDGLIEMIENKIKPTKTGIFMIDHIMGELLV